MCENICQLKLIDLYTRKKKIKTMACIKLNWLGLLDIAIVKKLGNYMFSTLEVDFATGTIKGNMVKCRIC